MKKAFNKAIAAFDYAAEVAQVWRDFPEAKDKVIFLDLCATPMLVCPGTPEERRKAQEMASAHGFLPHLIDEYLAKKGSCCLPDPRGPRYLLLYTKKHAVGVLSKTATVAQETAFVFDHELGHAIIPDGTRYQGNDSVPECIADAYALIRHFQRFGADSTAVDALVDARAFYMIFKKDRHDHFTSPVAAAILAQRYNIDWNALTPQQTVQMAHDFALKHAMERDTLLELHDDFDRYHGKNEAIKGGDDRYLRTLAEKVMAMDFCNLSKCGAAALNFCLEGHIPGVALESEYWQKLRGPLASKHKKFMQQSYLLSDPEAQPPSVFHAAAKSGGFPGWRR